MSKDGNPFKKMMDEAKSSQEIIDHTKNLGDLRLQKIAEDIAHNAASLLVEIIRHCRDRNTQVSPLESQNSIIITLDGFAIFRMGFELEIEESQKREKWYHDTGRSQQTSKICCSNCFCFVKRSSSCSSCGEILRSSDEIRKKEIMQLIEIYQKEPIETERKIFETQDRTVAIYVMRKLQNLLDESEIGWEHEPNGNIKIGIPNIVSKLSVRKMNEAIELYNSIPNSVKKETMIQALTDNGDNVDRGTKKKVVGEEIRSTEIDFKQILFGKTNTKKVKNIATSNVEGKKSVCNECGKEFSSRNILFKHLKEYVCTICGHHKLDDSMCEHQEDELLLLELKEEEERVKLELIGKEKEQKLANANEILTSVKNNAKKTIEEAEKKVSEAQSIAEPYIWTRIIREYAIGKMNPQLAKMQLRDIQNRDLETFGKFNIDQILVLEREKEDKKKRKKEEELKYLANDPVIGINGLPMHNIRFNHNVSYED